MAVTQTQQLPAPFISALGEKYGAGLGQLAGQPFTQAQLGAIRPTVAPQTGLQQQATTLAGQVAPGGVAAYQPYVQAAEAAGTAAGTALGDAGTQLTTAQAGLAGIAPYAAQTTYDLGQAQTQMAGVSPYITGAAGLTGPMTGAQMATIDPTTGQTVTPTLLLAVICLLINHKL